MHQSSYDKMADFAARYLDPQARLTILDLGAMDVNGSYRPIFENPAWRYSGLDLAAGPNVDLVLGDPYHWSEIPDGSIDVLVSGQALEHIEFFWVTFSQIAAKLASGGLACIIAPSRGPEHRYPVDCWRFYPDAYAALARWSGLTLVEVSTDWPDVERDPDSMNWGDTFGVFRKG